MAKMIVDISSEKLRVAAYTDEGKTVAIPNSAGKFETQMDLYANPDGKIAFGFAPAGFYRQGGFSVPNVPYELPVETLFTLDGGRKCSGAQVMYMLILKAKQDLQDYLNVTVSGIGFVVPAVYSSQEYNLLKQIADNLHCKMLFYIRGADALVLYQHELMHEQEQKTLVCYMGPKYVELGTYHLEYGVAAGEGHCVFKHSLRQDLVKVLSYPFEEALTKASLSETEYNSAREKLGQAAGKMLCCPENGSVTIYGRDIHRSLSQMTKTCRWQDICRRALPYLNQLITEMRGELQDWENDADISLTGIIIGGDAARYPVFADGLRRSLHHAGVPVRIADTSTAIFSASNYYFAALLREEKEQILLLNSMPKDVTLKLKSGYKTLISRGTPCPYRKDIIVAKQTKDIQLIVCENTRPILSCWVPAEKTPCILNLDVCSRGIINANVRYDGEIILRAMRKETVETLCIVPERLPQKNDIR